MTTAWDLSHLKRKYQVFLTIVLMVFDNIVSVNEGLCQILTKQIKELGEDILPCFLICTSGHELRRGTDGDL